MAQQAELLQGTLDLLILRTLDLQPLHGVGISDRIEQVTRGVFIVGPDPHVGSLLVDQFRDPRLWAEVFPKVSDRGTARICEMLF